MSDKIKIFKRKTLVTITYCEGEKVSFPVKVCEEVLGQAVGSDRQGLKKVSMPLPTDVTDKIK